MVHHHGLTAADRRLFEAQLRAHHEVKIAVHLLDLDRHVLGSISPKMIDGQINADVAAFGVPHGPQRQLTLNLLDPGYALDVDTAAPRDGTIYYDRLIQVDYDVRVPALGDWVSTPVFCGPPHKLQRTDADVYIEADDASVLGMGEVTRPLHLRKGMAKLDAAAKILDERCGFPTVRFPGNRRARLAHPVSLGPRAHGWAWAARILASMDLHLFINGQGIPVARRWPTHAAWTFNEGPGGEIIDPVSLSTDRSRFANAVEVIGRKPKGAKHRVSARVVAPHKHANSPWQLARENGNVPYFKWVTIHNDHLRTDAECRAKALRVLADRMRNRTEMTASILPWPHLEPGDMARMTTGGGGVTRDRISTYTLPLGVDGAPAMTLGWHDDPRPHVGKIRR